MYIAVLRIGVGGVPARGCKGNKALARAAMGAGGGGCSAAKREVALTPALRAWPLTFLSAGPAVDAASQRGTTPRGARAARAGRAAAA